LRVQSIAMTAALAAFVLAARGAPAQTTDSTAQSGADLPTVAVLDFDGLMLGEAGNSVNLGKAVSAMLVTELTSRPGLRVIERQRLKDILTEQKLALSGRVDESTAIKVGKLLGAQYVVHGSAVSWAGDLRMDVQAVDVETGKVLEAVKKQDKATNLLNMVVSITDEFAKKLDLSPPSERPPVEAVPIQATIEFSRAVDYEDKGDTAQAIAHYQKVLEIAPDHRGAKAALARLQKGGGS
jgi:TolB-like protein